MLVTQSSYNFITLALISYITNIYVYMYIYEQVINKETIKFLCMRKHHTSTPCIMYTQITYVYICMHGNTIHVDRPRALRRLQTTTSGATGIRAPAGEVLPLRAEGGESR
jgi:hypothetical protein